MRINHLASRILLFSIHQSAYVFAVEITRDQALIRSLRFPQL